MAELKDKICIITGANRGIGRAVLSLFAQAGATIYANARQTGSLDALSQELADKYPCQIETAYFDIRDDGAIKNLIRRIQQNHGKLDVLVNNAGIMQDALLGMITAENMQEIFATNVFATISFMQYAVRLMKRNKSGSIINFSSVVGVQGNKGQVVYAASKGAVIALTKSAAKELAEINIRVNAVAPGMIDTDMFRSVGEERINAYMKQISMKRLGTGDDIAKACLWLASDNSAYVTGQIIGVDGGVII